MTNDDRALREAYAKGRADQLADDMRFLDALRQCRDALQDIAIDLAIEQQNHLTSTLGNYKPHKHKQAANETAALRAALSAANAAIANITA